jgi:hypothetical protein
MYKNLTREENPDRLISLYEQSDDFRRQALFHITSLPAVVARFVKSLTQFLLTLFSSSPFDTSQLTESIDKTIAALNSAKLSQLEQLMMHHKILVQTNRQLEEKSHTPLLDKNLRETYSWAVVNQPSHAAALQKQHKLTDKQCWRWAVDALSEAGAWEKLEHFVREHKPHFGYLPLIKAFMRHGQKERALKFMDKVPPTHQIMAYEVIG